MLMTVMPMMSTMKITEKMFRVSLFWVLEEIGFLRWPISPLLIEVDWSVDFLPVAPGCCWAQAGPRRRSRSPTRMRSWAACLKPPILLLTPPLAPIINPASDGRITATFNFTGSSVSASTIFSVLHRRPITKLYWSPTSGLAGFLLSNPTSVWSDWTKTGGSDRCQKRTHHYSPTHTHCSYGESADAETRGNLAI